MHSYRIYDNKTFGITDYINSLFDYKVLLWNIIFISNNKKIHNNPSEVW